MSQSMNLLNFGQLEGSYLQNFVYETLSRVESYKKKYVDQQTLRTMLVNELLRQGIRNKREQSFYEDTLQLLRKKRAGLAEQAALVEQGAQKKAKGYLNRLLSFYFAQIVALQYGTYVLFSWDIIEPITCLLGIFDVLIAYVYWLSTHHDYSWQTVYHRQVQLRKKKFYKKELFLQQDLDEVDELIAYCERQKNFYADSSKYPQIFQDIINTKIIKD